MKKRRKKVIIQPYKPNNIIVFNKNNFISQNMLGESMHDDA
jgi:hypothetical protein